LNALEKLPSVLCPVIMEAVKCDKTDGRRAYAALIRMLGAESCVTQIAPDESGLRDKLLQLKVGTAVDPHVALVARACADPMPEFTRLLELGYCTAATVQALHYLAGRANDVDNMHRLGHEETDAAEAAVEASLLEYEYNPVENLSASMTQPSGRPFRLARHYKMDKKATGGRDADEAVPEDVACRKPQFTQLMRSKRKQMLIIVWCLAHREPIGAYQPHPATVAGICCVSLFVQTHTHTLSLSLSG